VVTTFAAPGVGHGRLARSPARCCGPPRALIASLLLGLAVAVAHSRIAFLLHLDRAHWETRLLRLARICPRNFGQWCTVPNLSATFGSVEHYR
jgi:hypothetical protein